MAEAAMAEVMIKDLSAPASHRQRLGIGMAMVATAFPDGLTEDEARGFLDRLFSDEAGYREQGVADLTGLITSNLSKQAEDEEMNRGDEGSEGSGARRSQRSHEDSEVSTRRADHGCPWGSDSVFYLDIGGDGKAAVRGAALLGRVRQEAQDPPITQRSTEWRIPGRAVGRGAGS